MNRETLLKLMQSLSCADSETIGTLLSDPEVGKAAELAHTALRSFLDQPVCVYVSLVALAAQRAAEEQLMDKRGYVLAELKAIAGLADGLQLHALKAGRKVVDEMKRSLESKGA